ncbi:hypothetical protein [Cellulomonas sp. Leaf334]|uniref:hypothetical protein n=1 Tax=Cellulomonas sp. Leaf334 TaxID=1736339 RepID=UPI0006F6F530|nr:hypothetical protein [Cellulomonas sp. Leaf334]KQR11888.1 hypothetical protein ASF78_11835 [Cellulomonas sp. Leaf334]
MSDTGRPGPERPAGPPTPPISNWQAMQQKPPTSPIPATPSAGPAAFAAQESAPAPTTEPPAASGRPKWLIPAIIGGVVVVIAAIVIAVVTSGGGDDTADAPPAVATTILLPSPTPSVEPVARPATTAFAVALPTSVLQYALATSAVDPEWQAAGAVEAYTETYTDGGSGTVTVRSGQWETPEEAAAFAATLVAGFPAAPAPDPSASSSASPTGPTLPQSGEVSAGGAVAGTYSIADAGDGTGVAVWTNGSTVFQATAPVADIADFYNAFPL